MPQSAHLETVIDDHEYVVFTTNMLVVLLLFDNDIFAIIIGAHVEVAIEGNNVIFQPLTRLPSMFLLAS